MSYPNFIYIISYKTQFHHLFVLRLRQVDNYWFLLTHKLSTEQEKSTHKTIEKENKKIWKPESTHKILTG